MLHCMGRNDDVSGLSLKKLTLRATAKTVMNWGQLVFLKAPKL